MSPSFCASAANLLLELLGCVVGRAPTGVGDAAAAHAGVRLEDVGGGELDLYLVDGEAEDLGHDLAEHKVRAGARVGQPDHQASPCPWFRDVRARW